MPKGIYFSQLLGKISQLKSQLKRNIKIIKISLMSRHRARPDCLLERKDCNWTEFWCLDIARLLFACFSLFQLSWVYTLIFPIKRTLPQSPNTKKKHCHLLFHACQVVICKFHKDLIKAKWAMAWTSSNLGFFSTKGHVTLRLTVKCCQISNVQDFMAVLFIWWKLNILPGTEVNTVTKWRVTRKWMQHSLIWPILKLVGELMPVLIILQVTRSHQKYGCYCVHNIYSGSQGRATPKLIIRSGQISNWSKTLCLSWLSASMMKIPSKMKALNLIYQHTCQCYPINLESPDFRTISQSPDHIWKISRFSPFWNHLRITFSIAKIENKAIFFHFLLRMFTGFQGEGRSHFRLELTNFQSFSVFSASCKWP